MATTATRAARNGQPTGRKADRRNSWVESAPLIASVIVALLVVLVAGLALRAAVGEVGEQLDRVSTCATQSQECPRS